MNGVGRLLIVLLTVTTCIAGAQPDMEFNRISTSYPGEHVVTVRNLEMMKIEIVGGKPAIERESYIERIYLDSRAGHYSEQSVDYSEFNIIRKIEAATLIPGKNDYKTVNVKDFKTEERISSNVFYDGTKSISFFYPLLQPKSKTYLKYVEQISEPRLMGSFYFQTYSPSLESTLHITSSNEVELDWKLFNVHDSLVSFSKNPEKNNRTTYTWQMKGVSKFDSETNAPDARYFMPHVIAWIKSYNSNGKKVQVLSETRDLYNWVYSITKDVNKEDNPALRKIVDSLVAGIPDEQLRVKKLFYWVQDHIRYIAVEDGMGGFVPRSATQVLDKRYGDCKDMSSILNTMLTYAGIKSHLTWIGSRDLPYTYAQTPTPAVDNHMIVTYIDGDEYYFLDPTGQTIPFGMPTSFIQGKEAMISIDSTKFEIREVPEVPATANHITDSLTIHIDDRKIIGEGRSTLTGYFDQYLSDLLMKKNDDMKKLVRGYLNKGSNKFLVDSVNVGDFYDRDKALIIDFTFNIEDYVKTGNGELYVNMNLEKYLLDEEISKDRKLAIEKRFKTKVTNTVCLVVPENYVAHYIPADVNYNKDERFGFDVKYRKDGQRVILTTTVYNNLLMINKSDFADWNKMIRELKNVYSDLVILKKGS
jgi:hypothetical protein